MTIYEQIKGLFKDSKDVHVSTSQIKDQLKEKFGTNPSSIIPSDYCYNRCNDGINFDKHIFEYLGRNSYKYLGEGYSYTGEICHKPIGQMDEKIIGKWINGKKIID
jgi:hypothetical protein